jgi:hypothetical protein
MKINDFVKGQRFLYTANGFKHDGVVNFIDDVGGKYITLTVGPSNLVIYPEWWDRLTPIDNPPCDS